MSRFAGLWLLAILAIGCANPFGDAPEPTARDKLQAHAEAPDAPPIVVPRQLPAGYGMVWANMYFPRDRPDDLPGIEVCVVPAHGQIVGRCVGTEDDSPWVSLEVEGQTVVIATVSAPERPELLKPWLELDWTSDWESVGWIDAPFGP